MAQGFRLKRLTLTESEDFEEGEFEFIPDDVGSQKFPFTTLIIGPNGTGKSRLLKVLIDIFNDLYNYTQNGVESFKFKHYYKLHYYLDGDTYEVENLRQELSVAVNDKKASIKAIRLPSKGIVAAYSLHEKFSPKQNSFLHKPNNFSRYQNNFYEYLGIKTTRNYTFSSANIINSIDLITSALAQSGFEKDLTSAFRVLGFLPKITVSYEVRRNRELFSGQVTKSNIKRILEGIEYRKAGFSFSSIQSLREASESEIETVVTSLNEASHFLGEKLRLPVELKFDDSYDRKFSKLYKHLSVLRKLNLINYDKIFVYKKSKGDPDGMEIDLRSLSSGEIQLLTSLLSLAAVVENNSLVLIDEPEISLHPNWQMQYIDMLMKIFKSLRSVHFIIASHSHLLACDIPLETSAVLSLTRDSKLNLVSELLDSPYGNPAESILYNVFGVATTRNYYFESDINRLLKLISTKSRKKSEITELISRFKRFKIQANDPLALIIKDAEKYIEKTWP